LNSSLFEPTILEHEALFISGLEDNIPLPFLSSTVIKDNHGNKEKGSKEGLKYLFAFLSSYDFTSDGSEDIQEDNKTLINASVLGLIFEKINGYKDGSFFTPGFITEYMCRETIRRAVVQKFNEVKSWDCKEFEDLYNKIDDIKEANQIVNQIKICDPAVGSGHFLVSALNEMISVKNDLKILQDRKGQRLKEYHVEIVNDELFVTDEDGDLYDYNPTSKESQRIQETLFHEKQTIIENCLFGVDINPNSVKICRLRLWIELLKNAYYKNPNELETLPNIDINIKCGNSLVSRFSVDTDLKEIMKKSQWSIDEYKKAVDTYRNAENKDQKREMELLINDIKSNFRSEITNNDPKVKRLYNLNGEITKLTTQQSLFEPDKKEKTLVDKQVQKLIEESKKINSEIEEIKSNKIYENAFEWRFEFPEVLNNEGDFVGFDVVIGNPPYVDAKKLAEISNYLRVNYSVYYSSADLSSYFFELGFNILKTKSHFSFISTNKFFRTEYGKTLRQYISNYKIHSIINFEQVPIFDEALVSSLIINMEKTKPYLDFTFVEFVKEKSPQNDFERLLKERKIHIPNNLIDAESWDFSSENETKIIKKLFNGSRKIKEIETIDIKRGITTGFDPAFLMNKDLALNFINKNPNNINVLKPMLKGREIKKYYCQENNLFLLNSHNGLKNKIQRINLEKDYSDLYEYLLVTNEENNNKVKSRTDQGFHWSNLRDCAFLENFDKQKIVWPLTAANWGFALDTEKHYLSSGGFMLVSDDLDLKYLLAILNSKLMHFLFTKVGVMTAGGAYTLKKATIDEFPIKLISKEQQKIFIDLVEKIMYLKQENLTSDTIDIETKIDQLVYQLYDLTTEEIQIIEGS
jgi:type II restriction/modification system DNA methylase subunit YeeA